MVTILFNFISCYFCDNITQHFYGLQSFGFYLFIFIIGFRIMVIFFKLESLLKITKAVSYL